MTSPPTITTIGEVLVDFVSTQTGSLSKVPCFVKVVGGEGANVAVALAKLGSHSVFVGKVGADSFGRYLVARMKQYGVDAQQIVFDENHKTRLAFISLKKSGAREFEFWEKCPAGEQLTFSELRLRQIKKSRIVNIAPLLLTKEPARTTAFRAAKTIAESGVDIAFDANVRLALWRTSSEARSVILRMVGLCSILRLNDDEAKFLTGESKVEAAANKLRSRGPRFVAVTMGANGCYFQTKTAEGFCPGYKVKPIDTTGCGDAFFAALLHGIARARKTIDELSAEDLKSICVYANAVGALTSLKLGGADGVPFAKDVSTFLNLERSLRLVRNRKTK